MLLISDMWLYWDAELRQHIEYCDRDRVAFRRDAAAAWIKLTELGCEGVLVPELDPPALEYKNPRPREQPGITKSRARARARAPRLSQTAGPKSGSA